jgi:hypothetical protein
MSDPTAKERLPVGRVILDLKHDNEILTKQLHESRSEVLTWKRKYEALQKEFLILSKWRAAKEAK